MRKLPGGGYELTYDFSTTTLSHLRKVRDRIYAPFQKYSAYPPR